VCAFSGKTTKPGDVDADPGAPEEARATAFDAASDTDAAADADATADPDAPSDADACACGRFGSMPDDRRRR
jgi:hypothetical protein